MAWSKVHTKKSLPLKWWYHKIMCEFGWFLRSKMMQGWKIYYKHLNKMCDNYNINLYGQDI